MNGLTQSTTKALRVVKNVCSCLGQHKIFLAIILISLVLKILLLVQAPVVNRDAVVYIAAAQSFSEGLFAEGAQHYRMPLYPLLLAAVYFFVPDWVLAGQVLNTLALLLCLAPIYLLTLKLFDRPSALAATLMFAVLPVFNSPATSITRDPLFLLLALSVLALLAYQSDKLTIAGIVGLSFLSVFATLIRIEGVLFFALVSALIVWNQHRNIGIKSLFQSAVYLGITSVLLAALFWIFSQVAFESQSRFPEVVNWFERLFTLELFADYLSLLDRLKEIQGTLPHANLKNNLIQTTRYYAPLVYFLGLIEILIKEVFPTALLALWALRWRQTPLFNAPRAIVVWPWAAFLLLNLLFCIVRNFTVTRYMWLPIVLVLPFVGHGISLCRHKFHHRRVVLALLLALFFVTPAVKTLSLMEKESRDSIRQAGEWLQINDPGQNKTIVHNDRRLALYANRAEKHADRAYGRRALVRFLIGKTVSEDADFYIFYIDRDQLSLFPPKGYDLLETFEDQRSAVVIFQKSQ